MPRKRTLKQKTLLGFLSSSPPSSPSELFPRRPSPSKRKRKRTRNLSTSTSSSSSSSSSSHSVQVANGSDSDVGAIHFEPEAVEVSDEDQSPRRPKRPKGLVGAHAIPTRASSDDSPEETLTAPRNRKGKNKRILDSDSDDSRPRKRKLIKGVRPLTPEEDDEDILDTQHQVLESRFRSRGKMTTYQKNLEKFKMLKGKKRGEIELESSSESEQSESSAAAPFKGAKPHHGGESDASNDETSSNEDDENDFIVDDDTHGVPPAQLPLAFSLSAHQDLAHHFKIVCQLFVHMAVRPLVERRPFLEHVLKEEEYLSVPLQVTRRKLSGMRDSLVASSIWRSDFKKTLKTYPNFTLVRMVEITHCDACHLGGRASVWMGRLSGQPYDEYDFEDASDDESHESSQEDVKKKKIYLGRFCAPRTRVYHRFSHWEYSLYKALQREISEAQDESQRFVRVAYFGGIKPPRDLHDADRVMEWLDQRGIIDMEWQKVRGMMEGARKLDRGELDEDGNMLF